MDLNEIMEYLQFGYETLMDYINSYNALIAKEQNETAAAYEAGVLHGLLIAKTIWLRSTAGTEEDSDPDIDVPTLAEIGPETICGNRVK